MNKIAQAVTVTEKQHGLFNDKKLYSFTLKIDTVEIEVTNLGCIILAIKTRDKNGNIKNIVAGYTTIIEYKNNKDFFNSVVGRYANRIANGTQLIFGMVRSPVHKIKNINCIVRLLWKHKRFQIARIIQTFSTQFYTLAKCCSRTIYAFGLINH